MGRETEEPLDLADLDLSRLRLSKKDLETLSNIAPGLPICFQEQLLAKLPPTQARKLSRTLSVQTNQNCSSIKVYKRSQSSGRNTFNGDYSDNKVIETKSENSSAVSSSSFKSENNEENVKDLSSIYNSDVNDKYKYYSPYVNKFSKDIGTYKNGPKPNVAENYASCSTMLGRPPSGRISPPLVEGSAANVPRRPTQRRISRLLRPDFCDQPLEEVPGDDKLTCISNDERKDQQTISTTSPMAETPSKLKSLRHVRNKSIELFSESSTALHQDSATCNRRCGVSGSSDLIDDTLEKHDLADKILQELQVLSSIRSQREQSLECSLKKTITEDLTKDLQGSHECSVKELSKEALSKDDDMLKEKLTSTIKKIKKVKTKEKSTESSTDADTKKTSVVVKKVKKIVKNSEAVKTPIDENESSELLENLNKTDLYSPKKISKLKRPKSYPMKESISSSNNSDMCHTTLMASSKLTSINTNATTMEKCSEVCSSGTTDATARESRLLRPKSYPSSKLATPKEIKKPLRSKITTIDESTPAIICPTKSDNPNQVAKSESSTNQPSEPSSTFVPKPIKVTKKSKLSPPTTTISANASTSDTTSSTGEDSKEPSPASTVQLKEKIAAKKPNKGLLYAIGQKFEKLRASATSNSCANVPVNKKSSSDSSSPEKSNVKSSTAKKTKSLENATTKIGKTSTNAASGEDTNKAENISSEVPNKPIKSDKRSRIDAMIRNLRERSVPRSQPSLPTESNYIKRAISVEEMPGTFNRKSVNKVLGLFKRYEKDCGPSTNRVRNTRSTSNIQRHLSETSPLYQNTEAFLKLSEDLDKNKKSATTEKCKGGEDCKCDITTCPDCIQMTLAKQNLPLTETKIENKGNKEKRKGLKLELTKSDGADHNSSATSSSNIRLSKKYNLPNDNEIYSNISPYSRSIHSSSGNGSISMQTTENVANNNNNTTVISNNNNNNITNNNNSSSLHNSQTSGYRTSSTHEINNQNNNMLSPSFENFGTYSSDSRSYQEDCASTSTFLSPTEEPELCFDTWSVCSEDNYRGQGATPSPTVSRLSSRLSSQASSPTRRIGESSEPSESVVDRIKRRSFYCRFNEKKPKRTSSIVGPSAVRDYYREQNVASKSRSSNRVVTGEREHSPDITQEFFRPLKLSPIGTELKPPVYRSPFNNTHDYSMATGKPRKSLNDIRTPTSPSCLYERRYGSFGTPENELTPSRYKLNSYDEVAKAPTSSSNTYYNTYNPKRRYSFNTNGSGGPSSTSASNNTSSSAHIEGYATLGRRPIRAYDHRTMSLLDTPSSSSFRNEGNSSIRDYTTNLSRSNSRYRKSSTSRSPTNI